MATLPRQEQPLTPRFVMNLHAQDRVAGQKPNFAALNAGAGDYDGTLTLARSAEARPAIRERVAAKAAGR